MSILVHDHDCDCSGVENGNEICIIISALIFMHILVRPSFPQTIIKSLLLYTIKAGKFTRIYSYLKPF